MPSTPYTHYLLRLATEQQAQPDATKRPDTITDPAIFVHGMLRFFDYALSGRTPGPAITRHGMERALDALFSLPDLTPVLDAPANYQNTFVTAYLANTSSLFQSYWTHIICPAWNQHADIRRTCLVSESAAGTVPVTATATATATS